MFYTEYTIFETKYRNHVNDIDYVTPEEMKARTAYMLARGYKAIGNNKFRYTYENPTDEVKSILIVYE